MQYDANEFYPTPPEVVADMLSGINLDTINTVLEPSAGKGSILKPFQQYKVKYRSESPEIDAIEISPELRHILKGEKFRVVHDDFLTYDTFKRYDLVIMNPPFSNGDKHLLKALGFVRGGGKLVCVLNAETIRNPYTNSRKELVKRLGELNAVIDFRQNAFISAENKTGVEIAIIRIDMPKTDYDSVTRSVSSILPPASSRRAPAISNSTTTI